MSQEIKTKKPRMSWRGTPKDVLEQQKIENILDELVKEGQISQEQAYKLSENDMAKDFLSPTKPSKQPVETPIQGDKPAQDKSSKEVKEDKSSKEGKPSLPKITNILKAPSVRTNVTVGGLVDKLREIRMAGQQAELDAFEAAKQHLRDALATGDAPLIKAALAQLFDSAPESCEMESVVPSESALQARKGVDLIIGEALFILSGGNRDKREEILNTLPSKLAPLWGYKVYVENNSALDAISCRGAEGLGEPLEQQSPSPDETAEVVHKGSGAPPKFQAQPPTSLILKLKLYLQAKPAKEVVDEEV